MAETMTFSDLVREAFIDPLRSVLIVDDQYPTWSEILNDRLDDASKNKALSDRSQAKTWQNDPAGPMKVIQQFRKRKPGFVIDIHDAFEPSNEDQADHLHQSDLLVLDYNLEGEQSGLGGAKARSILQSVLSNKHFNLVVVHTGEHDLQEVFFDCLLATMASCSSQFEDGLVQDLASLDEKLDDLEAEESFDRRLLAENFGIREYLFIRDPQVDAKEALRLFMSSTGVLQPLGEWGKSTGLKGRELKTFLFWAIREFEKQKQAIFSAEAFDGLTWKNSDGCVWLRTVRGFVAFVEKGPEDLLAALQKALESWQPTPSRLISAKYRHELSSVGVEAEDRTLLRAHVFAHFYKDYVAPPRSGLTPEEAERLRIAKLKAHVSRQTEAISFHIEDEVVRFGEKIKQTDSDTDGAFSLHYGLDLGDAESPEAKKAVAHYNSYVSTLPLKEGDDQLDSGHIFVWNSEWWVCATPACDLQPGQNTTAFVGSSATQRPFTALKLLKIDDVSSLTSDHINSGLFCFVEQQPGEVVCLGLQSIGAQASVPNGKATWRTLVAKSNGCIADKKMQLAVPKFNNNGELVVGNGEAVIKAKLRYEYALNYIQKVGTSVVRIGLGYSS